MEESGGIEPRWLSTSPRFSGALGDHSPALSLEHPAAVETANTWVAITSLLHFAFGCTTWYPARDSNSEYPDPKSGGFANFPSRAKSKSKLEGEERFELSISRVRAERFKPDLATPLWGSQSWLPPAFSR